MSGITLRQLLMSINRFENIRIEDEFGRDCIRTTPWEALQTLTDEQLEQKYDYIRLLRGKITIGMSFEVYEEHFKIK